MGLLLKACRDCIGAVHIEAMEEGEEKIMNPYEKCLVCYKPIEEAFYHPKFAKNLFGKNVIPTLDLDQADVDRLATNLINQRPAVPGVQRKLSLKFEDKAPQHLTLDGYLSGTYILKPPTAEYPHMPEVENLTMHLAEMCGMHAHGTKRQEHR